MSRVIMHQKANKTKEMGITRHPHTHTHTQDLFLGVWNISDWFSELQLENKKTNNVIILGSAYA